MKYYVFTFNGDGLPIALKLQQEGHEVIVGQVEDTSDMDVVSRAGMKPEASILKTRRLTLYDNMIKKVPAWQLVDIIKSKKRHDNSFVFFDRNNLYRFAEALMHINIQGNFPTKQDYILEIDRDEAKQYVRQNYPKIRVAEVHEFNTLEEARPFLLETQGIWVLKGKDEHAITFIPDVDDPILAARQVIQRIEADREKYEQGGFILEAFIDSLIEITPEKIYYDGTPLAAIINIENKTFGSGNTSIQTGCAQDLVFPIPFSDRINEIAFPPVIDKIAREHKGLFYWDASLLIDKRSGKIYFGEFCSNRPGYNELFTQIAQCNSVHNYFNSLMHKKSPFTLGTVGTSLRIFNPDTDDEQYGGVPPRDLLIDYKKSIEKDLWLWDVYKKGDNIVSAGFDWSLAVITGSGKSIDEAVNKMYRNVDDFAFVGSYSRPKFDFVSLDYPTSIPNRLNYAVDRGLFRLPFNVKIGELKATMY